MVYTETSRQREGWNFWLLKKWTLVRSRGSWWVPFRVSDVVWENARRRFDQSRWVVTGNQRIGSYFIWYLPKIHSLILKINSTLIFKYYSRIILNFRITPSVPHIRHFNTNPPRVESVTRERDTFLLTRSVEVTNLCWNDKFRGLKRTGPCVEVMCWSEGC